jgi:RimJ/RimL family protein N-acetyltransferase
MRQKEHPCILLRPATPADAATLSQLAWAGKALWGYPEEWMAAWRTALTLTPHYIESNGVLCGEEAGRLIGCVAFQHTGGELWLDHFWLDVPSVGTGRGRALFQLAARHAEQQGVRRFMIESDPNAEGFYLRMGCRRVGAAVSRLTGSDRVLPVLSYDVSASPAAA